MKLGYREKNGNKFISDKFSDFKKHKCGCTVFEELDNYFDGYDSYEPYTSDKEECKQFMTDACKHLKRLGYDTVEPIFHYRDMGEYNADEHGFFLVKDDIITEFVTFDFADGFLKAVNAMQRS